MGNKKKVSYFYDQEIGNFHYGPSHPMKPHRVRMTHDLINSYDLLDHMDIYVPQAPTVDDLTQFHANDYIDFLYEVSSENMSKYSDEIQRFNLGHDCPVFDGLWDFCGIYSGGSIGGAQKLMEECYDVAINWSGGLHHGKRHEASGFCYINDCVLSALEMLQYQHRVLYLDIDVHHGDGVEEAFYCTPRVMSCSFHKYGDYFPGTGSVNDIGIGDGRGYSVNVPLRDGIDDETFMYLFERVMDLIMTRYRPQAIILQSGADSLSGDRLGRFNLSLHGHSCAVRYLRTLNIPLLILGGGGYTLRNVPRCWTYETSLIVDHTLDEGIPISSQYYGYYGPDYKIHIPTLSMGNKNERQYTDDILTRITENFREFVSPICTNLTAHPSTYPGEFKFTRDYDYEGNQDMHHDRPIKEILSHSNYL